MHDQPEETERDQKPQGGDQDPAPTKQSDAERVTGDQAAELEDDPARNPPDDALREVKRG
jgi:hypothetical protein